MNLYESEEILVRKSLSFLTQETRMTDLHFAK